MLVQLGLCLVVVERQDRLALFVLIGDVVQSLH